MSESIAHDALVRVIACRLAARTEDQLRAVDDLLVTFERGADATQNARAIPGKRRR